MCARELKNILSMGNGEWGLRTTALVTNRVLRGVSSAHVYNYNYRLCDTFLTRLFSIVTIVIRV